MTTYITVYLKLASLFTHVYLCKIPNKIRNWQFTLTILLKTENIFFSGAL